MGNWANAYVKGTISRIADGMVVCCAYYGLVEDDYDVLEVCNHEDKDNPYANVREAMKIANLINALPAEKRTVRKWWEDHQDDEAYRDYVWLRNP